MLEQHYSHTKGQNVDICSMVDKYLRNTILKYLRELDDLKQRIETVAASRGATAAEALMQEWVKGVRALYPYLAEAFLREDSLDLGKESLKAALQKSIGRSGAASGLKVAVTFSAWK
jgi:hypothetical protein